MRQIYILLFMLLSVITYSQGSNCSNSFKETFEGYSVGSNFVYQSRLNGDNCLSTWDCTNGLNNPQDAIIRNSSYSGNYLNFYSLYSGGGPDDIVRYLGNKTKGVYELCFDIRVRSGKCAIYSLLHNFVCNDPYSSDYAFTTRFTGNYIQVQLGYNNYWSNITSYSNNAWSRVKYIFDLDKNLLKFYPNSNYSYYYSWSFDASNKPVRNITLAAIDFWTHSNADYDIDNFQFTSLSGPTEIFSTDKNLINYPSGCSGVTYTFNIYSNTTWTVNAPSELNLVPSTGSGNSLIRFEIPPNPSSNSRQWIINFTYGINNTIAQPLIVTQAGCSQPKYCYFDPPSITYLCNGGTINAFLNSNDNWSYLGPPTSPTWIKITGNEAGGSGSKNIGFSAEPNNTGSSRSGTIIYSCGGNSIPLYVSQSSCSTNFSSNPTSINVDCKSQTSTLVFTSTSDWQLQDKPSWVQSVQPSSGFSLNTNVTISILPNNSPNSRNDFITISYGTPSQTYKIPISQNPCPINNYCFFDPSILNIDEYDSTFTVKVNSNSTWSYNTGELSWVTVNPKIGSGSGQITIRVSANSTNQSRSTKLVFNCGTSGNTFSLDVIQAMNSCSFSAIPNPIMIGANGGVIDTLKINSSSTWFRCDNESDISTDNNLIGGPLVKDRIGVLTIKPNSSFIPRILKLKFCYCNNSKEYEVIINQKGSTLDKTPPWKIIKTAKIHTVVIEKSVQSDIFGKPIEIGDWIGFFYKDDTSSCAGEGQWDAKQDLPIIIYGDDPLTSIIDGFKVSQQFLIKIRRYHTFNDIKLEASYYPANGNPYNSTNKFSDGGYSGIYFVKADNCVPVPVHFGNSLISSYIKPLDSNMLNIFKPFSSSIRTVVDDQGNVTLPWNNVNTIGNWNYRKAYKLSSATEFTISDVFCGDKIIPENEIISIRANEPVFIPYLRDNVKSVDSEFNKYKDKILWMKDENLDLLLLPQINLVWGDLEPFKGYVLKARVPFDLVYSPNFKSTDLEIRSRFEYKNGDFFKSEFANTNNATALIIPDNLATLKFRIGDELAVFNTLNQVCGSTIYSGGHLVLKMWGDNSFTESKDGLLDYEDLKFKKYSKNSNLIEDVKFSFTDKIPPIFDANKMFIVSSLEESEINIIRIYPNPVSEKVYIEGIVDIESIDVLGTLGNIVKIIYNTEMKPNLEVDLSLLTSGTYFFKFNAFKNKAAQFRKVLICR